MSRTDLAAKLYDLKRDLHRWIPAADATMRLRGLAAEAWETLPEPRPPVEELYNFHVLEDLIVGAPTSLCEEDDEIAQDLPPDEDAEDDEDDASYCFPA